MQKLFFTMQEDEESHPSNVTLPQGRRARETKKNLPKTRWRFGADVIDCFAKHLIFSFFCPPAIFLIFHYWLSGDVEARSGIPNVGVTTLPSCERCRTKVKTLNIRRGLPLIINEEKARDRLYRDLSLRTWIRVLLLFFRPFNMPFLRNPFVPEEVTSPTVRKGLIII